MIKFKEKKLKKMNNINYEDLLDAFNNKLNIDTKFASLQNIKYLYTDLCENALKQDISLIKKINKNYIEKSILRDICLNIISNNGFAFIEMPNKSLVNNQFRKDCYIAAKEDIKNKIYMFDNTEKDYATYEFVMNQIDSKYNKIENYVNMTK